MGGPSADGASQTERPPHQTNTAHRRDWQSGLQPPAADLQNRRRSSRHVGVKRTITLDIAGNTFRLISDAEPSHLEELAQMINQRVDQLGRSSRSASSAQLLALAALDLADELKSAQQRLEQVEQLTRTAINNAIARIDHRLQEQ